MTRLEFITKLKQEARVQSGDLDELIESIVSEVLVSTCRKNSFQELLRIGVPLTLTDGDREQTLPADFLKIESATFSPHPMDTTWRIWPRVASSPRIKSRGFPRQFFIANNKIVLQPYTEILSSHILQIDYYINPLSLFENPEDEFPVPSAENLVYHKVLRRIGVFHKDQEAVAYSQQDVQDSLVEANSDGV